MANCAAQSQLYEHGGQIKDYLENEKIKQINVMFYVQEMDFIHQTAEKGFCHIKRKKMICFGLKLIIISYKNRIFQNVFINSVKAHLDAAKTTFQ